MINCVDTETKTCFFGYGGIKVDANVRYLALYGIKPPVGAGTRILDNLGQKIGDWEYTGNNFLICFTSYEEANRVNNCLKEVEKNQGGTFKVDDITFDFTKYEQASVDIVREAMSFIIRNFLFCMAC